MFASKSRRIYPALIMFAIGFGAAVVRADDATANQQMQQKIDQLEAKVQSLEAQQAESNNEDATTLKSIQTSADQQSKLLSVGAGVAGYDPASGFNISSDDGNFLLHPWVLAQFRGAYNDRQSVKLFNNGANPGGGSTVPQIGSGEHDGFEVHHL